MTVMDPVLEMAGTEDQDINMRKTFETKMRYKKQTLQNMTRPLKYWLYKHKANPYPTKAEKEDLARDSQMTFMQVNNWFANARRRLKNTVPDPNLSWGRRVKMYNSCAKGNQELLSISSEDSAWESGDEEERHQQNQKENRERTANRMDTSQQQNLQPAVESSQLHSYPVPQPIMSTQIAQPQVAAPVTPPSHSHSTEQATHILNIKTLSQVASHQVPTTSSWQASEPHKQQISYNQESRDSSMVSPPPLPLAHPPVSTSTPKAHESQAFFANVPQSTQPQFSDFHPTTTTMDMNISMEDVQQQQQRAQSSPGLVLSNGSPEENQPPKFKNSILQRYLQDSYQHTIQQQNLIVDSSGRHRNPSGSLSSHDFEDVSVSSRSTPTKDYQHEVEHPNDYAELWKQWPSLEQRVTDELHWKELSAALALTALSRGDYRKSQP